MSNDSLVGIDVAATRRAGAELIDGAAVLRAGAGRIDVAVAAAQLSGSETAMALVAFQVAATRLLADAALEFDTIGAALTELADNVDAATSSDRSTP